MAEGQARSFAVAAADRVEGVCRGDGQQDTVPQTFHSFNAWLDNSRAHYKSAALSTTKSSRNCVIVLSPSLRLPPRFVMWVLGELPCGVYSPEVGVATVSGLHQRVIQYNMYPHAKWKVSIKKTLQCLLSPTIIARILTCIY